MVDMMALHLAEREHPQGDRPSMVGMLGKPAPPKQIAA